MTNIASSPIVNVLLTREEVRLLVGLLQAPSLPGLDVEPSSLLSPEQEAVGLIYAEKSLRARELARLQPDGRLGVNTTLLAIIETCVRPEQAVLVQHITEERRLEPLYGHSKQGLVVAYTLPEPDLFRFSILPDMATFLDRVMTTAHLQDFSLPNQQGVMEIVANHTTLSTARQAAEQNGSDAATVVLEKAGVAQVVAQALAQTLAAPHRLTILTIFTTNPSEEVIKEQLTVIATSAQAWLMRQQITEPTNYRIKPVTADDIRSLLVHIIGKG